MKKVQFSTTYEGQIEVTINGDKYGTMTWVLWPVSIDDGVSYSDDLVETEETITDEIQSYAGGKA